MSSLADYFAKNAYKPRWFIGDRVSGKHNGIPFIGTVGNDSLVSLEEGPRVSVFLDLPMRVGSTVKNIVIVKPKDLKRLISYNEEPTKGKNKTK